jgi:putative spermidine/putrescine transport system permease protein
MADIAHAEALPVAAPRARRALLPLAWLGVAPFFIFTFMFLIWPTLDLVAGAFLTPSGEFTLNNIARLNTPTIRGAYLISIKVSLASALLGAIAGFFLAHAVVMGRVPRFLRPTLTTFSGVASNFAGIPLAFAFIATLGPTGLITKELFLDELGVNVRSLGFNLLSFWGLTITYLYFQIPLMVLILMPALDGLKKEWREASAILGASTFQYWRHVALPVLWPSMLGTTILLFANAFGAVATAYALTGSSLNIVPILLFAQIRGDVLHDPHLGYALALGMIVITGAANIAYIWLRARGERWIR